MRHDHEQNPFRGAPLEQKPFLAPQNPSADSHQILFSHKGAFPLPKSKHPFYDRLHPQIQQLEQDPEEPANHPNQQRLVQAAEIASESVFFGTRMFERFELLGRVELGGCF